MNKKGGLFLASVSLGLCAVLSSAAFAQAKCDIPDVIFMVKKEKLKSDQIRGECGSAIKGAGECSVTKVIRLANEGMDEDEIADECRPRRQSTPDRGGDRGGGGSRVATICATPAGSCPMMVAIPVGSTCNCSGPWGTYWGQAR